ncbi:MAG: hypothetical protein AAF267_09205 [Deinococcota bacterium]
MTVLLTWLYRYAHVAAGSIWLGGYLVLTFVMIPALGKDSNGKGDSRQLEHLAHLTVRVLTYVGTATIVFGLMLVTRTRGFASLNMAGPRGGEWGGIIITCIIIAVALLGIGDGALRPALRRIQHTQDIRPARRWALVGFSLTLIAVGLMTRALYASS